MLTPALVAEIRHLLHNEGLSQRSVARQTGVSRGTVHAIAQGKRPERPLRRPAPEDLPRPEGPLQRCPGCGGMVYMPCLLCLARGRRDYRGPAPDAARSA